MARKKFSDFPLASIVGNGDTVVGLKNGANTRFPFAAILAWLQDQLSSIFVPQTRTVNSKALNADITLDASDVGAYELPSNGIPKTDLAQGVQDSLDSADSAYQLPSGGIPSTDLASAVQTSLGKADSAYQLPSGGIPSSDMASAVQTSLGKADTAYQKPSAGIPSSDMTSAVQTSLGKADSAYQKPSGGIPASDLASGVIPTVPSAYASNPAMDGTASPGSSGDWARGDHVHPTDTSRQAKITAFGILEGDGDGGITAAWIDVVPTENSGDLVESGGVYEAIRKRPRVVDLLFNQAETVVGGKTINLSENVAGYSYLAILMLTESASDYNHRTTIVVPTISLGFNSWFPVIADNVSGAVRITSVSGQPKQLSFAATTLSALWVRRVDGIR